MEDSEAVGKLQEEALALMMAWADRGYSPGESAMVLSGVAHMILAKTRVISLSQLVEIMTDGWSRHNGKL